MNASFQRLPLHPLVCHWVRVKYPNSTSAKILPKFLSCELNISSMLHWQNDCVADWNIMFQSHCSGATCKWWSFANCQEQGTLSWKTLYWQCQGLVFIPQLFGLEVSVLIPNSSVRQYSGSGVNREISNLCSFANVHWTQCGMVSNASVKVHTDENKNPAKYLRSTDLENKKISVFKYLKNTKHVEGLSFKENMLFVYGFVNCTEKAKKCPHNSNLPRFTEVPLF